MSNNIIEIDHVNNHAAPEAVTSQSMKKTHGFIKLYHELMEDYLAKLDDWMEIAVEMENAAGRRDQVSTRLEFELNQECQQAWIALYGNRSQAELEKGEKSDSRTVRFSSAENLAYWENRWYGDITANADVAGHSVTIDTETGEINGNSTFATGLVNEPDGMYGPSAEKMNCAIRLEEARRNFARLKAKLLMVTEMYGLVTGTAFVYKPYEERQATPSNIGKLGNLFSKIQPSSKLIKKSA